ncbi:MAG: SEC-C domain-containing protein [Lachnospiraceae bacterium]|jgi:hypothetical protein|nr:SEC-C domain-containing protein [Lachnospiraceae bacterium]
MALLEQWREAAYGENATAQSKKRLWDAYFKAEKAVYADLLADPKQVIEGTVEELAGRFGMSLMQMTGFLDGINESLAGFKNPIDDMEADTPVKIQIDPEQLYMHMVEAKADWLYGLPQWDGVLSEETRKELYHKQKTSGTVVKGAKIGRNDPCPCGSGKKYKKCCGAGAA